MLDDEQNDEENRIRKALRQERAVCIIELFNKAPKEVNYLNKLTKKHRFKTQTHNI